MSRRRRANYTAQEKLSILREVLIERRPVSEVSERHQLQPSQFYTWQKQLFENGTAAFGRDAASEPAMAAREIATLKARLATKDEVIADISQVYVQLRKARGVL